jgi:hypothetical protein
MFCRAQEPFFIGLCLMGLLSTSLTVVGMSEQGLVELLLQVKHIDYKGWRVDLPATMTKG